MIAGYAAIPSGSDIPEEGEWERDRETAESQAVACSREDCEIYKVVEITVREVGRTRISVVLDTI